MVVDLCNETFVEDAVEFSEGGSRHVSEGGSYV